MAKPLTLRLTLPLPTSINEHYATVNGRRVSTLVARRFKQRVQKKIHELEQSGHITNEMCGLSDLAADLLFRDAAQTRPGWRTEDQPGRPLLSLGPQR